MSGDYFSLSCAGAQLGIAPFTLRMQLDSLGVGPDFRVDNAEFFSEATLKKLAAALANRRAAKQEQRSH